MPPPSAKEKLAVAVDVITRVSARDPWTRPTS
jgi:hypothetical protein